MRSATDYRRFARQSRRLAAALSKPADKRALELMAKGWDKAAERREAAQRSQEIQNHQIQNHQIQNHEIQNLEIQDLEIQDHQETQKQPAEAEQG